MPENQIIKQLDKDTRALPVIAPFTELMNVLDSLTRPYGLMAVADRQLVEALFHAANMPDKYRGEFELLEPDHKRKSDAPFYDGQLHFRHMSKDNKTWLKDIDTESLQTFAERINAICGKDTIVPDCGPPCLCYVNFSQLIPHAQSFLECYYAHLRQNNPQRIEELQKLCGTRIHTNNDIIEALENLLGVFTVFHEALKDLPPLDGQLEKILQQANPNHTLAKPETKLHWQHVIESIEIASNHLMTEGPSSDKVRRNLGTARAVMLQRLNIDECITLYGRLTAACATADNVVKQRTARLNRICGSIFSAIDVIKKRETELIPFALEEMQDAVNDFARYTPQHEKEYIECRMETVNSLCAELTRERTQITRDLVNHWSKHALTESGVQR